MALGPFFSKYSWIVAFPLLTSAAQAAQIDCRLAIQGQTVAAKSHAASKSTDPDSFQFELILESAPVHAAFLWQETKVLMTLTDSATGTTVHGLDSWSLPLEQSFRITQGNARMVCELTIADGDSWNWTFFKQRMDSNRRALIGQIGAILTLASLSSSTPDEEARLKQGICLKMGEATQGKSLTDLETQVLSLSGYKARFPDISAIFYEGIFTPTRYLPEFCVGGITSDPHPLPEGNRAALVERAADILQQLDKLEDYVSSHFPDSAP